MGDQQPIKVDMSVTPEVVHFFDEATATFSYVVKDPDSNACAIIDPVMDIDYAAGRTSCAGADRIVEYVREKELANEWIIETHIHADHLTAAPYIKQELGGKIGVGDQITVVQKTFAEIFDEGSEFRRDGSQFDQLFTDGESYMIGAMTAVALHTPGHTPACMSHLIGNATFVGDTLFMPDGGTARADFPGGDARTLYHSIERLLSMPDEMRLFMCHDYPDDRAPVWLTTVADEKRENIHVNQSTSEDEFVSMRETRDKTLEMPRLILPSLQVNMRAGQLPPADEKGKVFLKVPINVL